MKRGVGLGRESPDFRERKLVARPVGPTERGYVRICQVINPVKIRLPEAPHHLFRAPSQITLCVSGFAD
jgi:hypothetical protein